MTFEQAQTIRSIARSFNSEVWLRLITPANPDGNVSVKILAYPKYGRFTDFEKCLKVVQQLRDQKPEGNHIL